MSKDFGRAFLSPYYERGGFEPADENDRPVFTGRWNGGAISLHLPMILAKARKEGKDFYEVLDYYMEMIRKLHIRTKEYLGELRASVNPLQFCEGGFYRGHLKSTDKIKPLLDYVTFSFGITALNELNRLYNGKSIAEDGEFPLQVMQHINDKLAQFKKEDHILYAVYGTPAESLCIDGNTKVLTSNGVKKIKDINVRLDKVWSYNQATRSMQLKKILWCAQTGTNKDVVTVKFYDRQTLTCTPDHPISVTDGKSVYYKRADQLNYGDTVLTVGINHGLEDTVKIKSYMDSNRVHSVEIVNTKMDVWNMEVEGNNNYLIGGSGETFMLVHNCGTQIQQFRKMYGIVENVSDKEYVSNSFHCHVSEDITPTEKQDKEARFWNYFGGGRIQYVRYPISYNHQAIATLVRRAMKMGLYEGVNLQLSYCSQCGYEQLEMDVCPKCGSDDLVCISRINNLCRYIERYMEKLA